MSKFSTQIESMRGKQIVGVYRIILADTRCYVGSTDNIWERWNIHYRLLKRGVHHSQYLQNAWDKYGEDAFHIELIQSCEPEYLTQVEQFWMDILRSVFNVYPFARRTAGSTHSEETRQKLRDLRLGTTMAPETCAKISAAMKGREQVGGFHGKEHSPETRSQMSESHKALPQRTPEHFLAISEAKIALREDVCIHGHDLTNEDNVQWRQNSRGTWVRRCRICHRDQVRRSRQKTREKKNA